MVVWFIRTVRTSCGPLAATRYSGNTDGLKHGEGRRIQPCSSRVIIPCDLWPFLRFVPNSGRSLAGGRSFLLNASCYIRNGLAETDALTEPCQPYGTLTRDPCETGSDGPPQPHDQKPVVRHRLCPGKVNQISRAKGLIKH